MYLPEISTVLCIGAHSDDIEIGCGGLLLSLLRKRPGLDVFWCVLSASPERRAEAEKSASLFLEEAASFRVEVSSFRDGYFPYDGARVKDYFEALKGRVEPDLILTHRTKDLHQDHRLVGELTWNTFRTHQILEYEIPKYEGDLATPNVFVSLDEATVDRKCSILMGAFPSQSGRNWFTADTFRGLARLRGVESKSPQGYAEGFYCRKVLLDF